MELYSISIWTTCFVSCRRWHVANAHTDWLKAIQVYVEQLTRGVALVLANERCPNKHGAWWSTVPACPTHHMNAHRSTVDTRHSGICCPPSRTSPPDHRHMTTKWRQILTTDNTTHTHTAIWFPLCPRLPGCAGTRRDIHPLTPETCCGSSSSFWILWGIWEIRETSAPMIRLNATLSIDDNSRWMGEYHTLMTISYFSKMVMYMHVCKQHSFIS